MKTTSIQLNFSERVLSKGIDARKYLLILTASISLLSAANGWCQLNVSITQTGTAANACQRTLTAQVQNGSGNYSYNWSVSTPGLPFPGPNHTQSIQVGLGQTTDFIVTVTDNATSASGNEYILVQRVLLGNLFIFQPNVFTPNNDGYNDTWEVTDGNKGYGPINAYRYHLVVRNLNNTVLYQSSKTVTTGHLGLMGGEISWNGRVNGTGNIVPVGTYTYSLQIQNCSSTTTFNNYLDVIY